MVKVRFAPSPTGLLHIGGARTALINFLFAKKYNGKFVLRIEDTDVVRSTDESTKAIIDGLNWLKISWDEGPYFQSQRSNIYMEYLEKLQELDLVYPCFCSKEEIEKEKEEARKKGEIYKYSGRCKNLTKEQRREKILKGEEFVYRFKVKEGFTKFKDLIKGEIIFDNSILDDFIIIRSDKTPVYNFSCVVDDIEMGITHVIRGEDHLSNTHKQILIYEALNKPIPNFCHLPLMLGKDREKLSKRHGSISIEEFRKEGYLPEAIINYLFLIGFSLKENREIFSLQEMIDSFSISKISKSSPIFDHDKLKWLNGLYVRNMSIEELFTRSEEFIPKELFSKEKNFVLKILSEIKSNIKVLSDISYLTEYFYKEPKYEENFLLEIKKNNKFIDFLKKFYETVEFITPFESNNIEQNIRLILSKKGLTLKDIAQPLRYLLTGRFASLGLFVLIELLGKDLVKKRLEKILC